MKKIFLLVFLLSLNLFGQSFITSKGNLYPYFYQGKDTTAKFGIGIPPNDTLRNTLTVRDSGTVGSETYLADWLGNGWKLWYDSSEYFIEIDNMIIRGTLEVWEFIINQIRATNGNLLVTSAARVDSLLGQGGFYVFEDVTGHNLPPFLAGDMIMCQTVNLSGATFDGSGDVVNDQYLVKRVIYKVDSTGSGGNNPLRVYVSTLSGAPSNKGYAKKGDTFIRFGSTSNSSRMGTIGMFTDEPNSPYMAIMSGVSSWSAWKSLGSLKTQIGNLNRLKSAFSSEFPDMPANDYGLFAQGGIYLLNGKVVLYDSGYVRSGKETFTDPEGGFWLGKQSGTGKFHVGDTTKYLKWDGTALTLVGSFYATDTTLKKSVDSLRSRVGSAEININALEDSVGNLRSSINLKANTTTTDSLRSRINTAEVDISALEDSVGNLRSSINLKANTTTTDSLRSRLSTAEVDITALEDSVGNLRSSINLKANTNTTDSLRTRISTAEIDISALEDSVGGLRSSINLRAFVTTTDSLRARISTAEAGISLNATNIGGLTASLLLYAKRDSIISTINLSPESIDISSDKINIYGIVKFINGTSDSTVIDGGKIKTNSIEANKLNVTDLSAITANIGTITSGSITGVTITGGTVQTATSGARIVLNGTNNRIDLYDATGSVGQIQGLNGTIYNSGNLRTGGNLSISDGSTGFHTFTGAAEGVNLNTPINPSGVNIASKFNINSSGQITEVNNITASGNTGKALVSDGTSFTPATISGTLTDGDKGDITVSGSGATWTVDNAVITYAKIQNVTDSRLLGRSAGSAGAPHEITVGTGLSLSGGNLTATGSAPGFNDVTTGTNTTATMTVGAGGTLTYTSTGVVNANQFMGVTSVNATEFGYISTLTSNAQDQLDGKASSSHTQSFSTITGGTNSSGGAFVVGNATSLGTTGTGSINATLLSGNAHTAFLKVSNNLSDLTSASTARTNLGLGGGVTGTFYWYDPIAVENKEVTVVNGIITYIDGL
jgi:hypothetical protein